MTRPLTAAEYVYIDRATRLHTRTKALIRSIWWEGGTSGSDRYARWRPGIPGTQKALDRQVQDLAHTGQFEKAARLITTKVKKAYKL